MANVTFVSLYDRNAYGLRLMSANLKKHGHQCHIIFLKRYDTEPSSKLALEPGEYPWMGIYKNGRTFKYAFKSKISAREFDLLRQILHELQPDVIGLTVNTPLRFKAVEVTRFIKKHFAAPVIWGGFDPTVSTADCLELCDYACVGEGDRTILEVAERIDAGHKFDDVCNLAFLKNGTAIKNRLYPLEKNLDNYPWRDNSPEGKYFIEDNRIKANHAGITDRAAGCCQAMSARGCPYRCSYCCEAAFQELYAGEKFLRRRSPEDLVAELAQTKRQLRISDIWFEDEIFAIDVKWLEKFVPLYKKEVGLPFMAYIYHSHNMERILKLLKSAGLKHCCLALESGSERINKEVFRRVYDRDRIIHAARLCRELGIRFYTDVITYNPYEEEEDLKKTLDVLVEMGGRYELAVNKLFALPGTKIAQQMERDGIKIDPSEKDVMFDYYCR
ncbi:MAG: radical SAM protein, partial [Deltaproteobacteria bacterium]|nr:radical SAM protein [Deltaproteobacteria bacterium]